MASEMASSTLMYMVAPQQFQSFSVLSSMPNTRNTALKLSS